MTRWPAHWHGLFLSAAQPDTAAAIVVVDTALDHSGHRDGAGGRRITVSASEELQNVVH
jgi:hypothetical protein